MKQNKNNRQPVALINTSTAHIINERQEAVFSHPQDTPYYIG